MKRLIDLESYPVQLVLDRLLQDKTTKQNIIFATDAYSANGEDFEETSSITVEKLLGFKKIRIQPRVEKAADEQIARTRKKAEVFTPSWIINKMNNHCDEEWFGRPNVFNTEDGTGWVTNTTPIAFEGKTSWKAYVDSKRLEITCGEAPYVVSRYDATTGEIIPIEDRIGILDRKLRVVNENAADDAEWLKWALRALQSSYGYEFQGDNLLIARVNVLDTMVEHYEARFRAQPDIRLLRKMVNIICWNLWQMDGLTGTIPFSLPKQQDEEQMTFGGFFDEVVDEVQLPIMPFAALWIGEKNALFL
ncbi:MAG: restriction endonuclease subunit M [Oscillospiraceae bacterium]